MRPRAPGLSYEGKPFTNKSLRVREIKLIDIGEFWFVEEGRILNILCRNGEECSRDRYSVEGTDLEPRNFDEVDDDFYFNPYCSNCLL